MFSHDGSFLLSAGDDGLLLLWDVTTGAVVIHFPVDEALPNNKYVRRGLGLGYGYEALPNNKYVRRGLGLG